jgi:hypothetical protein
MTPKEKASTLTAEWLRDNLVYEPTTGVFLWKMQGFGRTRGRALGTKVWPGYLTMKVSQTVYYAHRLAWLYVHGEWPSGQVDHIDGNKANNAISNLRLATPSQNSARKRHARRVAVSRGVMPHGAGFVARIHNGGKRHYLGYFSTAAAAKAAYEAKAKELHGEFAYVEKLTDFDAAVDEAVARSPHRDWLQVATPGFGANNG